MCQNMAVEMCAEKEWFPYCNAEICKEIGLKCYADYYDIEKEVV